MQKLIYKNKLGRIINSDSLEYLKKNVRSNSVDLIVTSPPFALIKKKSYGNVNEDTYLEWIKPFIIQFKRVIKPSGSIVIDIGGAWNKGLPTKSIYQYKFLIMMVEDLGLHLIHDYFWWNPNKLPTPAEWVTIRRIRVKDSVNNIFWLAKTPYPKSSNKRVLNPYSERMEKLFSNGYKAKKRPSGHKISEQFSKRNKGAIPSNLLAVSSSGVNIDAYSNYCKEHSLKIHDARFPSKIPEYFIRLTTDESDFVIDPFSGSSITGAVASSLNRKWLCLDSNKEFCRGGKGWFVNSKDVLNDYNKPPLNVLQPISDKKILDNSQLDPKGGKK